MILRRPGAPGAPWSLQRQLVVMLVATLMLAWAGGVVLTAFTAREEAEKLHDREMKQVAWLLLGLSGHELVEIGADTPLDARIHNGREDTKETLGEDYRYQIWSNNGRLLLTNFGEPSASAMARLDQTGFIWLDMDGERWRVFTQISQDGTQVIQVAERASLRAWSSGIVSQSFLLAFVPSFLMILMLAIWLLRHLMQPLRELAGMLQQRSPANLDHVHLGREPAELAAVVAAINRLFGRVAEAIRREAGFTSLAAHELRTPLATLKVLADQARQTGDAGERDMVLSDLSVTIDRLAHLQEQLLTLSRLEVLGSNALSECVELTEVVDEAMADLRYEARQRHVKVVCHVDGSAILGHRYAVLTLARNIIGNAIRYAPVGGRVEISTLVRDGNAVLRVDDSGPGIPEAERMRAFDRFERLSQRHGAGVGLGLSIVRTVAQMHDALVTLGESQLGGLSVDCEFTGRLVQRAGLDLAALDAADSGP